MIEVAVDSVQASLISNTRVVLLRQKGTERFLPILVGPFEAEAIAIRMGKTKPPRPLTHDLLQSMISTLGAAISYILVNDLSNGTFYARIMLETNGGRLDVDSRPSDAIALAVRANVPIYVAEEVMREASITPSPAVESKLATKVEQPEDEDLSAFEEFIDSLDIDDLGSSQPGEAGET